MKARWMTRMDAMTATMTHDHGRIAFVLSAGRAQRIPQDQDFCNIRKKQTTE
jgi:hypothetical protein